MNRARNGVLQGIFGRSVNSLEGLPRPIVEEIPDRSVESRRHLQRLAALLIELLI